MSGTSAHIQPHRSPSRKPAACSGARREPRRPVPKADQARHYLFEILQPIKLTNCELQRFGEAHDGGYLMCGNLLEGVESVYSYGISGYDGWGCDVATSFGVPVHQYDCFDARSPDCEGGDMRFHHECVGGQQGTFDGRLFDTVENQFAKNGDAGRLHFNNFACRGDLEPFPSEVYEVLFVSRRLGPKVENAFRDLQDPSVIAGHDPMLPEDDCCVMAMPPSARRPRSHKGFKRPALRSVRPIPLAGFPPFRR